MELQQIIRDVFGDYKRLYDLTVLEHEKLLEIALIFKFRDTVTKVTPGQMYSICWGNLSRVTSRCCEYTLTNVLELIECPFELDIRNRWYLMYSYGWAPRAWYTIDSASDQLYDLIMEAFFNRDHHHATEAEALLKEIEDARLSLDSIAYVYGCKKRWIGQCNETYPDCVLDVAFLKGDRSQLSSRLRSYIDDMYEIDDVYGWAKQNGFID